jgi:hypothetical protein
MPEGGRIGSPPETTTPQFSAAAAGEPVRTRWMAVLEDGVLAGIVGAAVVAVWFLILDAARDQIFFTPSLIGSVLFLGKTVSDVTQVNGLIVFAYTGLHGILSLFAGVAVAFMVYEFEENPQFGILLLMLFLLFESILFSFEAAIFPGLVGAIGTLAVASANLFSAVAMFWFVLRRHPTALSRMREAWEDDS